MNSDMIEAGAKRIYQAMGFGRTIPQWVNGGISLGQDEARNAAHDTLQAALSAAVHKFDPQDQSTWPQSREAPSGQPWLIRHHLGFDPVGLKYCWQQSAFCDGVFVVVGTPVGAIVYMDPTDLFQ